MKKLIMTGFFAAGFICAANSSLLANGTPAPEAVAEGVEISGAVDVVAGWQHDDGDASTVGGNIGGMADYDGALVGSSAGNPVIGNVSNADHFRFLVNQVEIDLQKSFGENIRLRADLDFGDFSNTSQLTGDFFDLEQAYVTANIAAGNGIEFLIGKFNAPVGVESVDTRDNWFISYAAPFRYLTPTNVTGAKLYYAFSDAVDLHVAVVNDLNGNGFGDSAIPSGLFRLGFNWGEEGQESTIGISGGVGPESDTAVAGGASNNAHWDFFGDMDALVVLSDTISIAAEGTYRQSNALAGGVNQKAIAGFAALKYAASDVWDVMFRANWLWEINNTFARPSSGASTTGANWNGPAGAGFEGSLYSGTIGTSYMITDDAKMKWEYRYDWANVAGPGTNSDAMSLMAQFAYSF